MIQRQVYRLKAGNINRLKITTEHLPEPADDEVQIEVHAIGLNFADVFAILGLYSATPDGAFIPGLEYAGKVINKGNQVADYEIGDRIMGVTRFGAYVSHLNIHQSYIIPLPRDWSYNQGASYLVQVLTAYYGLKNLGNLQAAHTVLIHSAAGGVGIWANRICKAMGAYTIGTIGSNKKIELLNAEGYDGYIVRDPRTFKQELTTRLNERNLDIIMECIGGPIMKIGFNALAPMGRHIIYGSAHYGNTASRPNYLKLIPKYLTRPRLDPQNMIKQNKSVMAFNLIYLFDNVAVMHELLSELNMLNLGIPIVGHRYTFNQLPDAIRTFQAGGTMGKVVIELSQD